MGNFGGLMTLPGPAPTPAQLQAGFNPRLFDMSMGVNTDPYSGEPTTPTYLPGYNAGTMALTPQLQKDLAGMSGLDAFKAEALRKGPSSWATLAKQDQSLRENAAREKGASETNAQTHQAMDNLASQGGLSAGARERATQEGAKSYLGMSQDLARQGNENNLQIGMNDEQNRIQQLGMLPGMEMNQEGMLMGARQGDLGAQITENNQQNMWNMNRYHEQMSAWAANKQAQATENSGKK